MRPTWTVVEHACRLNNVVRDRNVFIHLTALPTSASQTFVRVSVVTGDGIRLSIASIIPSNAARIVRNKMRFCVCLHVKSRVPLVGFTSLDRRVIEYEEFEFTDHF